MKLAGQINLHLGEGDTNDVRRKLIGYAVDSLFESIKHLDDKNVDFALMFEASTEDGYK